MLSGATDAYCDVVFYGPPCHFLSFSHVELHGCRLVTEVLYYKCVKNLESTSSLLKKLLAKAYIEYPRSLLSDAMSNTDPRPPPFLYNRPAHAVQRGVHRSTKAGCGSAHRKRPRGARQDGNPRMPVEGGSGSASWSSFLVGCRLQTYESRGGRAQSARQDASKRVSSPSLCPSIGSMAAGEFRGFPGGSLITHAQVQQRIEAVTLHFLTALLRRPANQPTTATLPLVDRPAHVFPVFGRCGGWSGVRRYFLLLDQLHARLHTGVRGTQRSIYYSLERDFSTQQEVNSQILSIAALLNVSRHLLHVDAAPRGVITGPLLWDGTHIGSLPDGMLIPGDFPHVAQQLMVATITRNTTNDTPQYTPDSNIDGPQPSVAIDSKSPARFVLVVEKEAVFQRLLEDGAPQRHSFVMVTGKGFPDVATRAAVFTLHKQLGLPVFGLADYNPAGAAVLLSYRSSNGRADPREWAVPLQWVGLHQRHVASLLRRFPSLGAPVTPRDRTMASNMLQRESLPASWKAEIALFVDRTNQSTVLKCELELLYTHPDVAGTTHQQNSECSEDGSRFSRRPAIEGRKSELPFTLISVILQGVFRREALR